MKAYLPKSEPQGEPSKMNTPSVDDRRIEVWYSVTHPDLYLLKLVAQVDGRCRVQDPQEGNKVVETFEAYDDAMVFMCEKEVAQVDGRMSLGSETDEVVRAEKPR